MRFTVDAVQEPVLVLRINRALWPSRQVLRKARGQRMQNELGEYFILDRATNLVVESHVHIEALGRRLGVLESWENVRP